MLANFPEKLNFLWEPARYKVLHGGRGGSKSWGVARWLLIEGAQKPLRILCCRETQKSIQDSVLRLLSDQIIALGLQDQYDVQKAAIIGRNGTEFLFAGLKHNVANIKSLEAVDRVFVEEAQTVSHDSWSTLIPTVRKEGSEIIIVFNPDLYTDSTYQRFVVHPPPGAKVVRIGWEDNPWFPAVLREEMEHLKATNLEEFEHVWNGACLSTTSNAIYGNELRAVDKENRITRVPYDSSKPVDTWWDLGYGDNTAIWLSQSFPFEFRLIDFIEDSRRPLTHYLKLLQERPYVYGTDHLPWDGAAKQLGTGRSIEELMREAGRKVEIVPKLSVADGINAARTIFPQCFFDADKCADGIQALRHYRYGTIQSLGVPTREPVHDLNSHASDAFRYLAVGIQRPERPRPYTPARPSATSWMG